MNPHANQICLFVCVVAWLLVQELQQCKYEAVGSTLHQLSQIELVDNALVTRLLHQAKERVQHALQTIHETAIQGLMMNDFDRARKGARPYPSGYILRQNHPLLAVLYYQ